MEVEYFSAQVLCCQVAVIKLKSACVPVLYIHEELPLSDEELSRWQWAETLIDSDEEKGTKPENTMTGIEMIFFWSDIEYKTGNF